MNVQIETTDGRYTAAVTEDVSRTGLLVLSRHPIEVGQELTIHLLHAGVQHTAAGRVVRHEPLAHDESAMWRAKLAVDLGSDGAALASILAQLMSRESK